jgi:O-antigen/teichoic acid export membrane protein
MILSIGYLFYDFLVIDFYFQSVKKIKLSAFSKFIAFTISGVLKIIALKIQLSFLWLALIFSLDGLILAIVLFAFLCRSGKISELFRYQSLSFGICRDLLRSSHPMITSGIAGILLTKVDQLMIAHYMTYEDVGLYSAASRIYDGWMSFVYILSISLLPAMLANKKTSKSMYMEKATEYFFIAIMLSFFFAIFISFCGYFLLMYLYGDLYVGAYLSIVILAWASLFSSFGYLSSRFLIVEGFENKISRRNWGALIINVLLNYILIPYWGIIGASIATFISVFIAHYIFDFFDSELQSLLRIKNDALLRMIGK